VWESCSTTRKKTDRDRPRSLPSSHFLSNPPSLPAHLLTCGPRLFAAPLAAPRRRGWRSERRVSAHKCLFFAFGCVLAGCSDSADLRPIFAPNRTYKRSWLR
jgi:hypothetical protein